MASPEIFLIDNAVIWLFICAFEMAMPWLVPTTVQFGVRIPPDKIGSGDVTLPRRGYVSVQLVITAATFVPFILLPYLWDMQVFSIAAPFAVLALSFGNYLRVRNALMEAKRKGNWYEGVRQETFAEIEDGAGPRANYMYALPALLLLILTLVLGYTVYPSLPAVLAVHFSVSGVPNGYAPKSSIESFFDAIMQAVTITIMCVIAAAVVRTRNSIESHIPRTSLVQQNMFKMLAAKTMLLMSFFINISLFMSQLAIWQILPRSVSVLAAIPAVAGVFGLTIPLARAGQYGSRMKPDTTESQTGIANLDDDAEWKVGAAYFNRKDSTILVPKRFGVGWTFNFANPLSWLILGSLIAMPLILLLIFRG